MKEKTAQQKTDLIPKKAALINDLSGYGRCSLAVSIPIVSALGIQACPLPTAILSNHTGYPSEYAYDFTEHIRPYGRAWKRLKLKFDGIFTGYMNSSGQIDAVSDFIDRFRSRHTLVFADPAMGDGGAFYRGLNEAFAEEMKEKILRKADLIKPNLTEACMLTGNAYEELQEVLQNGTQKHFEKTCLELAEQLAALGPEQVVITGIERGERLVNVIFDRGALSFDSGKRSGRSRAGTGDIFSAVMGAMVLRGMKLPQAVHKAATFLSYGIALTDRAGLPSNDGVLFEPLLPKLTGVKAFEASMEETVRVRQKQRKTAETDEKLRSLGTGYDSKKEK